MSAAMTWRLAHGRSLSLGAPRVMGVLNVTPDSFSDGGLHDEPGRAVEHALAMRDAGAAIIDLGGESTRPGAARVDEAEQIRRTVPVIERLEARGYDGLISIDTTRAGVARAAIGAGAHIINDVSAAQEDDAMLALAAETGAGLVLMHRRVPPERDSFSDAYDAEPEYAGGVVERVREALGAAAGRALDAGVTRDSIVLDPGLGFGKSVAQNYELIARTGDLMELGYPVLSAASRKSFIGAVTGVREPGERLAGSIAVTVAHALAGVRLFRVHDVGAHAEALAVVSAVLAQTGPRARESGV